MCLDKNGNGYVSLAETGGWIKATLRIRRRRILFTRASTRATFAPSRTRPMLLRTRELRALPPQQTTTYRSQSSAFCVHTCACTQSCLTTSLASTASEPAREPMARASRTSPTIGE